MINIQKIDYMKELIVKSNKFLITILILDVFGQANVRCAMLCQ